MDVRMPYQEHISSREPGPEGQSWFQRHFPRHVSHPDAERAQTKVRVVISLLICAYALVLISPFPVLGIHNAANPALQGGVVPELTAFAIFCFAETLAALGLFAWVRVRPGVNLPRRFLSIFNDYGFIAVAMSIGGRATLPVLAILVWITVGYGLRYGPRYLMGTTVCACLTIASVLLGNPYWLTQPYVVLTAILTVLLVPAYLLKLLSRMTVVTEELTAANRAKNNFIATMNHELRNPLNTILGMSTLLEATKQTGEQSEYTHVIHTSAQTVANIVHEVLDLAAIEAGKIAISKNDFSLQSLVSSLAVLHGPAAQKKGITLSVLIQPETAPAFVGDASRISQILNNLVGNAIKFTEQGRVEVLCRQLPVSSGSPVLCIDVLDTGVGIPDAAKARIFEPFEQASECSVARAQGTGLGVAICRSLARAMGGDLYLRDNAPAGSVFTVHLPLAVSTNPSILDAGQSNVVSINDVFAKHRRDVRKLRVLVVEDQAANRLLLERLLHRAGHHATLMEDPTEALDHLVDHPFDLIFLDLNMPQMSGLEFVKHVRVMQSGMKDKTPVVILSGDTAVDTIQAAMDAGANEFLSKPVHPAKLLETVSLVAKPATPESLADDDDEDLPVSQVQHLANSGISTDFIDEYRSLVVKDMRSSLAYMQATVFKPDRERLSYLARDIRELAAAIEAHGVRRLAAQAEHLVSANSSSKLSALLTSIEAEIAGIPVARPRPVLAVVPA